MLIAYTQSDYTLQNLLKPKRLGVELIIKTTDQECMHTNISTTLPLVIKLSILCMHSVYTSTNNVRKLAKGKMYVTNQARHK